MQMATPEQIAELRWIISPFNSSIAAVNLKQIEKTYELFMGQERGIVHPRIIFAYLKETKPMPMSGYDSVRELMTARC